MTIPNIILSILSDMKASHLIADFTYQTPGKSNVVASQMECPMAILSTFTDFMISANRRSESAEVNLFFLNRQTLDFDGVEDLNNPDKKGTPEDLCFNFLNRLTQYRYLETESVKMSSTFDSNDTNLTGYALQMRITDRRSFCIDEDEGTRSTLYVNSTENGVVEYDVAGFSKAVVSTNVTQPEPETPDYVTFTALEDSVVGAKIAYISAYIEPIEFSTDGTNWNEWDGSDITLKRGEYVKFRGDNYVYATGSFRLWFVLTGKLHLSGNIRSLLNSKLDGVVPNFSMPQLFGECEGLYSVSEDFLEGCDVKRAGLWYMFNGCSNLTNVPKLPESVGVNGCTYMFNNCTSLTDGGVIYANNAGKYAFNWLFNGCSNLRSVTVYADVIDRDRFLYFLNGVAPEGVLRCPATTIIERGLLPSGWVRENI